MLPCAPLPSRLHGLVQLLHFPMSLSCAMYLMPDAYFAITTTCGGRHSRLRVTTCRGGGGGHCTEYLMLVEATTTPQVVASPAEVVVCSEYLMLLHIELLAAQCPPLTPHPPLQPARRRCSCSTEFLQAGLPASGICYILCCGGHRRTKA